MKRDKFVFIYFYHNFTAINFFYALIILKIEKALSFTKL